VGKIPAGQGVLQHGGFCWKTAALVSMVCIVMGGKGSVAAVKDDDPAAATRLYQTSAGHVPQVMAMGTNLDGLAYWSSAMPTLDLMKSAGGWLPQAKGVYDTGETVSLDRDGWPLAFAASPEHRYRWLVVNVLHDNPAAPPAAHYAILYDGRGPITALDNDGAQLLSRKPGELHVMAGRTGSLYLRLDPDGAQDDPVRNIRVVLEKDLPLLRAGLTFAPDFMDRVNRFQVLRFMDWMNTNAVFPPIGDAISGDAIDRAPLIDWSSRPLPSTMRWGEGTRGMPVEAMVELANRTGAAPWFNMPINAGDDYIRSFAAYVRAHLRPDLGVHVELSNEVWNRIFPQARYADAQARATWGAEGDGLEWYGMRAAQVGAIWKAVFGQATGHAAGPGRVAMVLGTQFDWPGLETKALDTPHWRDSQGSHLRAADSIDDYAITGYYDGTMSSDAEVPLVKRWWQDADGGYGQAIAALANRIAQVNARLYRYHAARARAYGLRLVTYESGYGESTPPSQRENPAYTDFLIRLQRRAEFTALENSNYKAFLAAGGSLYMNFGIVGTPSRWGSWSALETVHQHSSPRYGALMAWLATHPGGHGHASIVMGDAKGQTIEGSINGYDVLVGGTGDDVFVAGTGTGSRMDGAGGNDVLKLPAMRMAYHFDEGPLIGQTVVTGPTGSLLLSGIARVRFGDGEVAGLSALTAAGANASRFERSIGRGHGNIATASAGR